MTHHKVKQWWCICCSVHLSHVWSPWQKPLNNQEKGRREEVWVFIEQRTVKQETEGIVASRCLTNSFWVKIFLTWGEKLTPLSPFIWWHWVQNCFSTPAVIGRLAATEVLENLIPYLKLILSLMLDTLPLASFLESLYPGIWKRNRSWPLQWKRCLTLCSIPRLLTTDVLLRL